MTSKVINRTMMENRIIPYSMLSEALSSTHELVERILPENGMPSLRIGIRNNKFGFIKKFTKYRV